MFKRHGCVDACLVDILQSLSHHQTSSQYFSIISSCGGKNCNLRVTTPTCAPFMLTPDEWFSITHSENPPHHESLQGWIMAYFNHKLSSSSHSCPGCSTECSQTLSFLQPPWIWFEVFVGQTHVVLPSFGLSFSSHTYQLAAVIYGNACHFVACISTPSGTWWHYDGQTNSGTPALVSITCEEDLITCGDGYKINVLVYCQVC